jgi:hypothetical protein
LDVAELTRQADVIVLGQLVSVVQLAPLNSPDAVASIHRSEGSIAVDRLLKGELPGAILKVGFQVGPGHEEITSGQHGLFFLRRGTGVSEFADETYPYLATSSDVRVPPGPPLEQITEILGETVESPTQLADPERERALDALRRLHTELAESVLRRAMQSAPEAFRLEIARSLVARNDLAGFSMVSEALLHPAGLTEATLLNLAGSLAGLRDPRAIPGLTKLIATGDPNVRRYAAVSFRQTGDSAALRPLSQLLNDDDPQTRYNAVAALGEITHQDEWTPALDEFHSHEARYLTYWRTWTETNLK